MATRLGVSGALVVGAVSLTLATTAAAASASTVNGGWFTSSTACYQAGSNAVDQPNSPYRDYACNYSATHTPHWHLVLYT
ncbi:hypothetical protein MRQ36_07220 [Micromonospora sp. R77]|uniref:hypothetical protein n=1 Tax=Micromonospora sp. R77 TaxID=2925836 RepID=UPI001F61AED1|nr:hypothetical protein [Micromonospora sp. R77]MCI4062362.1 hypothetical protein [Micromonospora sp. R77]